MFLSWRMIAWNFIKEDLVFFLRGLSQRYRYDKIDEDLK